MKSILKILLIVIVLSTLIGCETIDTDGMKAEPDEKVMESLEKTTENKVNSTPSVDASTNKAKILKEEDVIGSYIVCLLRNVNQKHIISGDELNNAWQVQTFSNFALLEDGTATKSVSSTFLYGNWNVDDNKVIIVRENGDKEVYFYEDEYLYRKVDAKEYTEFLDPNPIDKDVTQVIEYYKKSSLSKWDYVE